MSARKPAPMNLSPTERQEAVRRIAEAEKGEPEKIDAKGVNSPATAAPAAPATEPLPESQEAARGVVLQKLRDFRPYVGKKPSTRPMTIRVPETLYDDLIVIQRMSGRSMTDVIVSATTALVEQLIEGAVEGRR
jgi:hypothetical protein